MYTELLPFEDTGHHTRSLASNFVRRLNLTADGVVEETVSGDVARQSKVFLVVYNQADRKQ